MSSKISALTSATTPLAGTETLPIVQSGATKQVSVANLTAGRSVSVANLTNSALTSGRITYATTGGLLTDNSGWTFGIDNVKLTYSGPTSYIATNSTASNNFLVTAGASDCQLSSPNGYDIVLKTAGSTKLTVSNSSDVTVNAGNLVQGTSGKGLTTSGSFALGLGTNGSTSQATLSTTGQLTVTGGAFIYGANTQILSASTFGASTWGASLGNGGASANYWKGDATYWQNASGTQIMELVSGNLTNNTGNYVPATAAKGVNFTANTSAAGMTSQLLNWYEEGTWTPADASGAGLTFTSVTAKYTRIGRQVTATVVLTYPTTVSTAQAQISGLPFAASNMGQFLGIKTGVAGASAGLVSAAGTTIVLYTQAGGNQTNANNTTATIYLTGTYFV